MVREFTTPGSSKTNVAFLPELLVRYSTFIWQQWRLSVFSRWMSPL